VIPTAAQQVPQTTDISWFIVICILAVIAYGMLFHKTRDDDE
jgi:hypothetical protein